MWFLPFYWLIFQYLWSKGFYSAHAISCYQCATDQLPYDADRCGASRKFQPEEHALVDCGSEDAVSPGAMCLKYTQLSPRAFIWDKRWKSVIRRCAQISAHGHIQGCEWGFDSRGTYWEQCYCTRDGCNAAAAPACSRLNLFCGFCIYILFLISM
ncbi:uncharacterized protein LOC129591596 [Paramacrobiotus metropolitanus]|uniref:uncharacterized protein LOC129591596 n=1 Tax=Paramacrobiotus metropolitanus TaxID=2943436 RepID=UPI0024456C13|nr:uncharacterized protein LOC129591596 [Paramacrobiotus metropolitanus]